MIRTAACAAVLNSCDIGKFSLSYIIKSALRSDAHSHERQMSAKADHARRSKSVLLGRKWNCEGMRSTLLYMLDSQASNSRRPGRPKGT